MNLRRLDLNPGTLQALSPQLRKAARFVVDHPGEIATRSQRSVAKAANLPAPTFTRLAQAIGYDSYDALRETCRAEVLNKRELLAERAQAMMEDESGEVGFAARHMASAIRNTEALTADLDPVALSEAAQRLARARRVVLISLLSARPIADYATYLANMSLGGWSSLGRGQAGLAGELADLGPEDVAIVLSIEPYSARSVAIASQVAALGVPLIALTDSRLAPVAEHASLCFCMRTHSPQFFPSHVAATVFFEAIIGMVIHIKGSVAQKRIAAVERQNHELGEYWQDKPASNKGD